jgi:short-subunit dehydrogenase
MKTVLITGASTGIGKELAYVYASHGHDLILMARREDLLQDLKKEILSKHSVNILIKKTDVSQYEQHIQDIRDVCAEAGGLDIVIANAGIGKNSQGWKNSWQSSHEVFAVNVLGAIATIETAKDIFLKQGHGQVVGISSVAGVRGFALNSAYSASKAAISTYLESLRVDLMPHDIKVTTIYPGYVETPLTEPNGKMQWLLKADVAAQKIYKAIAKKKARFVFPWQMAIVFQILKILPGWFYDFLGKVTLKKVIHFRQERD